MEFIAAFWWLWLSGVVVSVAFAFGGFFKSNGVSMVFMAPAVTCWILFLMSVILNLINYAADKFA